MACGTSGQQRVDALINFALNETAAAGRSLKFNSNTLMIGTPVPEFADSIHIDLRSGRGITGSGEYVLGVAERRLPGQPVQFCKSLS